jgi:N-acetylglutamate synthase-like GNAT family acetyltransferase
MLDIRLCSDKLLRMARPVWNSRHESSMFGEKMLRNINFECLTPITYPLANRFYKQAREKGKTQGSDEVYVARIEQQIIAVVRLCPISERKTLSAQPPAKLLLRSLAVLPEYRRTGIGTQFMKYVVGEIGTRECWCYPFSWLQAFYEQFGFHRVEPASAPEFIRTPFENYQRQGRDILIMAFNSPNKDSK